MSNNAAHFGIGTSPVERARKGAASYQASQGISADHTDYGSFAVAPTVVHAVARAYNKMPDFDPRAVPAFDAMREQVKRQYDHLTGPTSKGGMGMEHQVTTSDPYTGPHATRDFFNDIHKGRIKTFSSAATGGHPLFSDDENDMFRAVHDVFGHAGTGRGVDRHGEEAAYQKHARMFDPLARQALATETRGQNHAMIAAGGNFADQKISLLPSHLTSLSLPNRAPLAQKRSAMLQAQQFHSNQGL